MRPNVEEPVTVFDEASPGRSKSATRTTHPAFGQITIARTSIGGGGMALYGDNLSHHSAVVLRIGSSIQYRDLHREWPYSPKEHIEVFLSEAQWSTLVSAVGVGEGVPCTISHVCGEHMPQLPMPKKSDSLFRKELAEQFSEQIEALQKQREEVLAMGLPKAKQRALLATLDKVVQTLHSNIPFTAEQFDRHMTRTTEKAKAEVNGYTMAMLTRMGLDQASKIVSLPEDRRQRPAPQIEDKSND